MIHCCAVGWAAGSRTRRMTNGCREILDVMTATRRSKSFHVHVEWPGNEQPWLILIEASSKQEARSIIEASADVRRGRGKVISVEAAAS